jgi:hypothetical protein
MEFESWQGNVDGDRPDPIPAPPAESARNLRALWRNLILRIWGEDPLLCPCCKGLMKVHGTLTRPEEIEFFLRLHGMWEGIIDIPPPPEPPCDIETMEPIRVPALFRWAQEEESETLDASQVPWQAPELPLDDERILVLDGDPGPPDEFLDS